MRRKRLFATLTVIAVLCTFSVPAGAVEYGKEYKNKPEGTYRQVFSDVPSSHWAFEFIGAMQQKNVLNGYPDGRYYPDNFVERCEFAKIMVKAADIPLSAAYDSGFYDVNAGDWFLSYVETAKNYLTGYNEFGRPYYHPNSYALREDIAVALVKMKGYDTSAGDVSMLKTMFTDYESISAAAMPYVATAVERGLVSGYEDGSFRGQDSITRAEAAAMLWRSEQYGSDKKVADLSSIDTKKEDTADKTVTEDKKTDSDKTDKTDSEKKDDDKKDDDKNKTDKVEKPASKNPYAIKTLAKANIEDTLTDMTMDDNNNVYYIDRGDNALYKVNAKSGKKSTVISKLSKLTYTETRTETQTETVKVPNPAFKKDAEEDKSDVQEDAGAEPSEENGGESGEDEDAEEDKSDGQENADAEPSGENGDESGEDEDSGEDEPEFIEETVEKEVEITTAKYSDYTAQQIYYDKTSGKLLLVGYFAKKENEQGEKGSGTYWHTLNANDTEEVISRYEFVFQDYNNRVTEEHIIGSLPNGQVVLRTVMQYFQSTHLYLLSLEDRYSTCLYNHVSPYFALQKGNVLYCMTSSPSIYRYNFGTQNAEEVQTEFSLSAQKLGMQGSSFYFWNITSGKITAYDVSKEKFRTLDIDTQNGVDLEDGAFLSDKSGKCIMLVTSDESFVFYDGAANALRILYKR